MRVLVVCKHPEYLDNSEFIDKIRKEFDTVCAWKNRLSKKDLENIDLVISLGGDGTLLSAAHYLIDKPILAVNSDVSKSEGALTTVDLTGAILKLDKIKEEDYKVEKLERIEILINGKPLDYLALNDVFIANEKAYLVSRYKIKFKEKEEEHRSSGLIFSTGTGSTAWFKSAGGNAFSPQSKFIKMIVREPYLGRIIKFSMLQETIHEKEEIEINSLVNSVLAVDSIREYNINKGDIIKLRISEHPLLRIS